MRPQEVDRTGEPYLRYRQPMRFWPRSSAGATATRGVKPRAFAVAEIASHSTVGRNQYFWPIDVSPGVLLMTRKWMFFDESFQRFVLPVPT